MRRLLVGLAFLAGCGSSLQSTSTTQLLPVTEGSGGAAVVTTTQSTTWISGAPAQTRVVVGADGSTWLGIFIEPPSVRVTATQRAPISLALVVDTSGSMAGDKIVHARMAAASLLESLSEGDIVSLYSFSNAVTELAPPTVLTNAVRASMMTRIQQLQPMGGTNMYDGLRVGEAGVMHSPASHPVRRVVVISDGMANVGPSSPEELGTVAANGTESGVQVSAIGVGLDYDERTLNAVALRSSGRFYHLQDPAQMTAILQQELQLLNQTVATEAEVEIEPAQGVSLLGTELLPSQLENGRLRVRLGAMAGGRRREILVRVRIDTTRAGEHELARANLHFRDASARQLRTQSLPLRYTVVQDPQVAAQSADARVQGMIANFETARMQQQAAEQINAGQTQQAAQVLAQVETRLQQAAAAQTNETERRVMQNRVETIRRFRSRAASPSRPAARAEALDLYNNAYRQAVE